MKTSENPFSTIYEELTRVNTKLDKLLNPPKEDYSKKFYTVKEASIIQKCTPATIINRINRGDIIPKAKVRPYLIPHFQIFDQDNQRIYFKRRNKA
ncbi:hypothetical protein [Formosa sp. PL04]|uniref:hypothetical protein n=1 Tax=Formosa sp. PL04 TaxID=3081755 RepID=UPI0029821AEB|nr:hypothetical protein [Formosa sp. PL04]MDW5290932.1 hypothetical protein [Formosa sp. PL04]